MSMHNIIVNAKINNIPYANNFPRSNLKGKQTYKIGGGTAIVI